MNGKTMINTNIKKLVPPFQTNQTLHAIRHDSAKDDKTDVQDKKINESSNNVKSVAKSKDDTMEEVYWTQSTSI